MFIVCQNHVLIASSSPPPPSPHSIFLSLSPLPPAHLLNLGTLCQQISLLGLHVCSQSLKLFFLLTDKPGHPLLDLVLLLLILLCPVLQLRQLGR